MAKRPPHHHTLLDFHYSSRSTEDNLQVNDEFVLNCMAQIYSKAYTIVHEYPMVFSQCATLQPSLTTEDEGISHLQLLFIITRITKKSCTTCNTDGILENFPSIFILHVLKPIYHCVFREFQHIS